MMRIGYCAEPDDFVFPNGNGKPNGHFFRQLKAIAKKADVEGSELHRFRKTYADTLHEEGVSVNSIRIRLGRESLHVALAHLKGSESAEAQKCISRNLTPRKISGLNEISHGSPGMSASAIA